MAKLMPTNNINARKCINTIVRSLLEKKKIHEHNDKELDYLMRPDYIVHANSMKHRKPCFIFTNDLLFGTTVVRKDYDDIIRDFAKEYTGYTNLKFKATLEQPEFVTNFNFTYKPRKLMPELESCLGLMLPEEHELYNPDSIKQLKNIFIKESITLPEKVTVNELLRKLAVIYVYPMCKQLTYFKFPFIMIPFAERSKITSNCSEYVMCGKHLGSDYFNSWNADDIECNLKINEEYDENAANYLSFMKVAGPQWKNKSVQFDFGAFAKLLDNTEDYFIPDGVLI